MKLSSVSKSDRKRGCKVSAYIILNIQDILAPEALTTAFQTKHFLTWPNAENLIKVSTNTHLLVKLRGLCKVGTAFEVGHGKYIGTTFTGSWKVKQEQMW